MVLESAYIGPGSNQLNTSWQFVLFIEVMHYFKLGNSSLSEINKICFASALLIQHSLKCILLK